MSSGKLADHAAVKLRQLLGKSTPDGKPSDGSEYIKPIKPIAILYRLSKGIAICQREVKMSCLLSRPNLVGVPRNRTLRVPGQVLDTCPCPGYPYLVRGRVDSEPEAGNSMTREKGNSLSLKGGRHENY
jgi:hypothetical protein